jgi:hypothetical protein
MTALPVAYRVTMGAFRAHAPCYDHMEGNPPHHDGVPHSWPATHPHCATTLKHIEDWWPSHIVMDDYNAKLWGYFKIVPKSDKAYLVGRTQVVVDPDECDIMEMTHAAFIAEVYR